MKADIRSALSAVWKPALIWMLILAYVAINLFSSGGDKWVIALNNFLAVPLALGVTLLSLAIGLRLEHGGRQRSLWLQLTIGWALWAIAELWWAIAAALEQEVPYPSWADLFWLAGYVPLLMALRERIRSLPAQMEIFKRVGMWVFDLTMTLGTLVLVLIPLILSSESLILPATVLDLLYPLLNLALLILVARLFVTYQQGRYGRVWAWLAVGFFVSAVADLGFSYANLTDAYYPDQQINLISTLGADVPYNLSYAFMLIGLLQMLNLERAFQPAADARPALEPIPNTHVLLFLSGENRVIEASANLAQAVTASGWPGRKSLAGALGLSRRDENAILKTIQEGGLMRERDFASPGGQSLRISGLAMRDPQGEHMGAILLVRTRAEDRTLDDRLTPYQKELLQSLLEQTGAGEAEREETLRLLTGYHQAFLQAYQRRAYLEGGSILADAFVASLEATAAASGWQVLIRPDASLDARRLSPEQARQALPALRRAAADFIARLIGPAEAERITIETKVRFGEKPMQYILQILPADRKDYL